MQSGARILLGAPRRSSSFPRSTLGFASLRSLGGDRVSLLMPQQSERTNMRSTYRVIGATIIPLLLAIPLALSAQTPRVASVDEKMLREYAGAYQWGPDAFLYLQLWSEFTGK